MAFITLQYTYLLVCVCVCVCVYLCHWPNCELVTQLIEFGRFVLCAAIVAPATLKIH
jgi:hypothetical protein